MRVFSGPGNECWLNMNDDWRVVFETRDRRACSDRALVLEAVRIPCEIVVDGIGCALVVPAAYSAAAAQQLMQYDEENPPRARRPAPQISYQNPLPGIVGYLLVICLVAGLATTSVFGSDWYFAGRIDGELLRDGQWWRTVTAMTLHSGLRHLLGNIVFGTLFGLFAGRLLGPGVTWLAVVLAGAAGNAVNTLLLDSAHRSVGASTAVFAALGLVAGFVWRGKLMRQDRWPYRVGPIVGGLALLMYTGAGGPNTDVGAHLMGFLAGGATGLLLAPMRDRLASARVQSRAGAAALAIIVASWAIAFAA
jgi:membrane associated rhomboid family serine protease